MATELTFCDKNVDYFDSALKRIWKDNPTLKQTIEDDCKERYEFVNGFATVDELWDEEADAEIDDVFFKIDDLYNAWLVDTKQPKLATADDVNRFYKMLYYLPTLNPDRLSVSDFVKANQRITVEGETL